MGYVLSPAYDMVATALVNPDDNEELALTLNGRKRKIERGDFIAAFDGQQLDKKQQSNIFAKMEKAESAWMECIDVSFVSNEFKTSMKDMIRERLARMK